MRYSGWLPAGWIAVTTKAAAPLLDESGDLPGGTVRRILIAIGARNAASKRTQKAAAKEFFAIAPDQARGRLRAGVYRRDGRKAIPILRFTPVQARYASRLNFTGQAQKPPSASSRASFPSPCPTCCSAAQGAAHDRPRRRPARRVADPAMAQTYTVTPAAGGAAYTLRALLDMADTTPYRATRSASRRCCTTKPPPRPPLPLATCCKTHRAQWIVREQPHHVGDGLESTAMLGVAP